MDENKRGAELKKMERLWEDTDRMVAEHRGIRGKFPSQDARTGVAI